MKTVSQLGSGKKPAGTTAYMGRTEHLMQCRCEVERAEDWLKPSVILEAFEVRAASMSIAYATSLSKFSNPVKNNNKTKQDRKETERNGTSKDENFDFIKGSESSLE